jgi:hypothetical protein
MGFIMNMHDVTSNLNSPFLISVKCDSNNNNNVSSARAFDIVFSELYI